LATNRLATAAEIIAEARSWIGTPYQHQASCKGAGADCLGLLRGVWRCCIGPEPETPPAYTPDWSETDGVERLLQAAHRHLVPVGLDDLRSGDVLVFRMRAESVAKHVGLLVRLPGKPDSMVHAHSGHGVVETWLTQPWQRRLAAAFRLPLQD
jgi:NlpC/P60 family putative phage cell wall peptidase